MNLFDNHEKQIPILPPLAERMRPQKLENFLGHENLTDKGKILQKLFENKRIFSIVLWGPPGSGKTTLAKLVSIYFDAKFYQLNAIAAGVKDVREIIRQAEYNKSNGIVSILFIDEIHRFNKGQQDALLHAVEQGTIIFIGATTENPSFEVNPPLLSRCRVLKLSILSENNLKNILINTINNDIVLRKMNIDFTDDAKSFLVNNVNGDARKLLNGLEIAVELGKTDDNTATITINEVNEALQNKNLLYDKKADYHYDTISAFIKSIRGSDPDAAVYWMTIMLEGGEDPMFIARRLIIAASEDVGNANPSALMLATTGMQAVHNIGLPEAGIILAQITTYLASSPKSNASYMAYNRAKAVVTRGDQPNIPLHLRNAPTKLMKNEGYGKEYKYPHDFPGHFVDQNYFPENIKLPNLYEPTDIGREASLKNYLEKIWKDRFRSTKKR